MSLCEKLIKRNEQKCKSNIWFKQYRRPNIFLDGAARNLFAHACPLLAAEPPLRDSLTPRWRWYLISSVVLQIRTNAVLCENIMLKGKYCVKKKFSMYDAFFQLSSTNECHKYFVRNKPTLQRCVKQRYRNEIRLCRTCIWQNQIS
jgi:hypothetical protein